VAGLKPLQTDFSGNTLYVPFKDLWLASGSAAFAGSAMTFKDYGWPQLTTGQLLTAFAGPSSGVKIYGRPQWLASDIFRESSPISDVFEQKQLGEVGRGRSSRKGLLAPFLLLKKRIKSL
jgi:hypothetical protein